MEPLLLVVAAVAFAVVSGLNDGATLIALSLPNSALRPLLSVAILATAIAVVPLVGGVRVAETLTRGLVSFEGRGGRLLFLVAVLTSLGITYVLSRRGLPTSLTLALVGAIVGTGIGRGLPVSWPSVAAVIAIGLAAPLVSGVAGVLVIRAFGWLPAGHNAWRGLRAIGGIAFLLQSVAYATNDGQKMIAILAIAVGLGPGATVVAAAWSQLLLGAAFALGTLLGIRRVARRLDFEIMHVRAVHSAASEIASAAAVLASAQLGAPVSTTQAATAAVVGAGASETVRRVRWEQAVRIGLAWVVTLPSSAAAAAVVAALTGAVR